MENKKYLKHVLFFIIGWTLLVLPLFTFGYDDKTTHPALTQEIVELFNENFKELKISDEDKEIIIQGSIDEDSGTRWMQHFYDPVYNRGLTLATKEQQLAVIGAAFSDPTGKSGNYLSSKEWSQNTLAQAVFFKKVLAGSLISLFSSENDYSWDRAVYEYAWGDKKRGLLSLGHTLHLVEDASVPDHTRNDPHPPILDMGSPYEGWTKKFDRQSLNLDPKEKPIALPDLNYYFDSLANYSNNNFFSKDTIFSKAYTSPVVRRWQKQKLGDGLLYDFGYSATDLKIVAQNASEWKSITSNPYFINDPDELILKTYWSLLSKQAVLHGAGVVKLFFDEVEKENQTKTLYNKNRSWLAKQIDKFKNFSLAGALYGT